MENGQQSAYPLSETVHTGFGPTHEKIFSTVHSGGLTKREYFAANAPKWVPEWFNPKVPEQPKVRSNMFNAFGKGSGHPMSDLYRKHYNDETESWDDPESIVPSSFRIEVAQYLEKLREELAAHEKWCEDVKFQRWVQWPWYWADQILKNQPE